MCPHNLHICDVIRRLLCSHNDNRCSFNVCMYCCDSSCAIIIIITNHLLSLVTRFFFSSSANRMVYLCVNSHYFPSDLHKTVTFSVRLTHGDASILVATVSCYRFLHEFVRFFNIQDQEINRFTSTLCCYTCQ